MNNVKHPEQFVTVYIIIVTIWWFLLSVMSAQLKAMLRCTGKSDRQRLSILFDIMYCTVLKYIFMEVLFMEDSCKLASYHLKAIVCHFYMERIFQSLMSAQVADNPRQIICF